ncbi:MAG: transporter substrate-binding domain-containing protein [Desulfobacteraceae bacterium]|nr:transporter substrate-binding domain-containing protein [Desulfobacteraceae bacterium]
MKFNNTFISIVCLIIAILVLYGRILIPHDTQPAIVINSSDSQFTNNIITIHYHERPPYYVTDSSGVYGLCSDPAKIAFETSGVLFKWQKTPAKRQLEIIKTNRSKECIIGWFKTSEREKFAKYSHYIYQDKPMIALARKDNNRIKSNRSLKETFLNTNLILLKKSSYSYGQFIDIKIVEFNPTILISNSENVTMLKMIHSMRADYFFISEEEANVVIALSGFSREDFKYIKFKNMPKGNKRYLLFSKMVEDDMVERINNAIEKFHTFKLKVQAKKGKEI